MPPEIHDIDDAAVAPAEPSEQVLHGRRWTDDYAWMRDHADPRLLRWLARERRRYDAAAEGWAGLQEELFTEVGQRLQLTDHSVKWRRGNRFYYTRTVSGSEYEQFCEDGSDRIILDPAEFAGQEGFAEIGVREISPDNRLLAYSVDGCGDEVYRLRFRDLETLADLPEELPRTYYTGAWSADSGTFFYTVHDELFRPHQVWRHVVGTPISQDRLVLQEDDARFELTVRATRDGRHIIIEAASRKTTHSWWVPAESPASPPVSHAPRREGVEYAIESAGEAGLVMLTNNGEPEFHVPGLHPARPGERLVRFHALRGHWLAELRRDGFPRLRAICRSSGASHEFDAGIPAGQIHLLPTFEYDDDTVVVSVQSLVEPPKWYRLDLTDGSRNLLKEQAVPGYDAGDYRTARRFAPAADGTLVPVTLAWREGTPLDGTRPALLYGYGAYESCLDPEFDPMLPSLLDRGVIYALTHVRGGGENGRHWWLDGHLDRKTNTFTDHLAVADWLASGIADGTRLATRGLSAGGLLQGAVYGMRPDRWAAVVAEVPFVDVVNSMLDPGIPLTVNEWQEWGDPRDPAQFAWLAAYSPYENVPVQTRPPLLVTAALHDPRVMVHEPAKWVARLHATARAGDGPVFLRTELGAGAHTGPAGRYAHFRYEAEIAAFWLSLVRP